jgi:ribosomal-protein-serine acetyltransferase
MEHPAEVLVYDRVELRRKGLVDVDAQHRLVQESLEHLTPWMPWASGYSRDSLLERLTETQAAWESGQAYDYMIVSEGEIVGSCSLMRRIGPGGLEIGYWIHPDWTGRGLVTMATAALVEAAFALPGTTHVEIHHDEANVAPAAPSPAASASPSSPARRTPPAAPPPSPAPPSSTAWTAWTAWTARRGSPRPRATSGCGGGRRRGGGGGPGRTFPGASRPG